MSIIQEHSIQIQTEPPKGDVNKQMEVFYNPIMKSHRNISILLLNCWDSQEMKIADPLASSGIRSLRFLQELKKGKIKHLAVNDFKENFRSTFKKNLKLNHLEKKQKLFSAHQEEASLFLLHQEGFDYIDIDPYGSPNPFLASAVARISRGGILAVTATDTAALTGTYPKVTKRKYWSTALKNYLMHELGLRILIRKVQLQGIQFDKALFPILAYHKDHYFRAYFISDRSKEKCDEIIRQLQYFLWCPRCFKMETSHYNQQNCSCGNNFLFSGPLWIGKILDQKLIKKMSRENPFPEEQKFLEILKTEAEIDTVGFYDLHQIAKRFHLESPRKEKVLKELKAVGTHFSPTGIRTKESLEKIMALFKKCNYRC